MCGCVWCRHSCWQSFSQSTRRFEVVTHAHTFSHHSSSSGLSCDSVLCSLNDTYVCTCWRSQIHFCWAVTIPPIMCLKNPFDSTGVFTLLYAARFYQNRNKYPTECNDCNLNVLAMMGDVSDYDDLLTTRTGWRCICLRSAIACDTLCFSFENALQTIFRGPGTKLCHLQSMPGQRPSCAPWWDRNGHFGGD